MDPALLRKACSCHILEGLLTTVIEAEKHCSSGYTSGQWHKAAPKAWRPDTLGSQHVWVLDSSWLYCQHILLRLSFKQEPDIDPGQKVLGQ